MATSKIAGLMGRLHQVGSHIQGVRARLTKTVAVSGSVFGAPGTSGVSVTPAALGAPAVIVREARTLRRGAINSPHTGPRPTQPPKPLNIRSAVSRPASE